jgi:CelD/BcsL family acetyltransferase involved in cellulose biosynthesis
MPIGAGLTDCQGLVHTPGFECDPRELLRGCGLSVFQFDHLMAEQRVFQRYALAKAPSPVIDLTGGFSAYRARLELKSAQFCRDTARKGRKLCREVGPLRLVADSRDQVAFRSLLAWKSSQYRRTGRTDRFAKSWIVGLVNDLFHIRESDFSGLFSVLYAGEVAVAAHFGVRSGPVLGHWFPAYDTRFGRYSPGSIQHLRMVEEMAAMGVRLIDMGKGAKRYKETLKTSDLYVCEGAVTGRSPLAMAHRAHVASGQWAVRTIRSNPRLFRSADYLLRRYGQLRSSIPNGPRERD